MSAFKPFVAGALAGAALLYGSLQYHVVRSKDGFFVVPRAPQASLGLAYADLRDMSSEELARRPELARAMAADSARKLLADNGKDASEDTLSDTAAAARDRLNATIDEWDTNAVPRPKNSTLDAPIWNPFADSETRETTPAAPAFPGTTTGSDDDNMFGTDELRDAEPWPGSSAGTTDVIPSAFDSDNEIEFDPYSDESGSAEDAAFMDIARELDKAREVAEARARRFSRTSRPQEESSRPFGTDVDLTAASGPSATPRTHTSNRVVTPSRSNGSLPRDENQTLPNAVTRRAREIYERTRRRSSSVTEDAIRRGTSKAESAIDELISPFDNLPPELTREADNAITSPQRYSRRAK